MNFSENIRKLRKKNSILQKDLSTQIGVTRQAIAAYESGIREPSFDVLIKIADFFGVSVDYLLGRTKSVEYELYVIGNNIKIIRNNLDYKTFADNIGKKTGILVYPELIEKYENFERCPTKTFIKILAYYACVSVDFFYRNNSYDDILLEKKLNKNELNQEIYSEVHRF